MLYKPQGKAAARRIAVAAVVREGMSEAEVAERSGLPLREARWGLRALAAREVGSALIDGRLARPATCSECGATGRIEGHHHDYTYPLVVEWLCVPCHGTRKRTKPRPTVAAAKAAKAERYREMREKLGPREKVAHMLGVTMTTLYRREAGLMAIGPEAEAALLRLLEQRAAGVV